MKEDKNKKEPEIDFEKLYYKAMKENVLLKDKKITFEFNEAEITFLRDLMYYELKDLQFDVNFDLQDDDEKEENMRLGKSNKNEFLNKIMEEKRVMIEGIIKKLRFEI